MGTRLRSHAQVPAAVAFALRLTGLAIVLPVLLPFVRLDHLIRHITPASGRTRPEAHLALLERYARRIGRWASWPKSGACLLVSLLQYVLRRWAGQPVVLHCGVRRIDGRIEGHAWIAREGYPILREGQVAERYSVIFSYPPDGGSPAIAMSRAKGAGP